MTRGTLIPGCLSGSTAVGRVARCSCAQQPKPQLGGRTLQSLFCMYQAYVLISVIIHGARKPSGETRSRKVNCASYGHEGCRAQWSGITFPPKSTRRLPKFLKPQVLSDVGISRWFLVLHLTYGE